MNNTKNWNQWQKKKRREFNLWSVVKRFISSIQHGTTYDNDCGKQLWIDYRCDYFLFYLELRRIWVLLFVEEETIFKFSIFRLRVAQIDLYVWNNVHQLCTVNWNNGNWKLLLTSDEYVGILKLSLIENMETNGNWKA